MRVLHINTNFNGGAAVAAIRLHTALLSKGVDSHMLFLRGNNLNNLPNIHFLSDFGNTIQIGLVDKINRAINYAISIGKPYCFFNRPYSLFKLESLDFIRSFDIINLHWVVKFINVPTFFNQINKPIVWTIHDMNPFSGGLHYKTGYHSQYDKLEKKYIKVKRNAYKEKKWAVISPSNWLLNLAKESRVFPDSTNFYNIYNTIDNQVYKPIKHLGSSNKSFKLLFVADNPTDSRKGFNFLLKSAISLKHLPIEWNVIGRPFNTSQLQINHLGYKNSDSELVQVYGNSDLFIIPSIEDNLPNTILESMSCGTPVIGFNSGGIPEIVKSNYNGMIVEQKNELALAKTIEVSLNRANIDTWSQNARSFAIEKFSMQAIASQYIDVYNNLISFKI